MARPPRNNVDYFPHIIQHTKELKFLIKRYGNDGYACYFMLFEQLGSSNYHFLKLTEPIEVMVLSNQLNLTEDTFMNLVNDMISLQIFNNELWNNYNILFSEYFVDHINDAYEKRKNDCINLESLTQRIMGLRRNKLDKLELIQSESDVSGIQNPESKEKERKPNENQKKEDEEDSDKPKHLIDIDILLKKYYKNDDWVNNVISNRSFRLKNKWEVLSRMQSFQEHLKSHGIIKKEESDFLKHFNSWLEKIKMKPIKPIRSSG